MSDDNKEGAAEPVAYANPVILLPGEDGAEWEAKVQGARDDVFSLPLYAAPQPAAPSDAVREYPPLPEPIPAMLPNGDKYAYTADQMRAYVDAALASRDEAPATPQREIAITDAMVDAYLKAQRETVERVDREWGGKTGKAAEHLHPVREACRNGLRAALTQPTTVQQAAPVDPAGKPLNDASWAFVNALPEGAHLNGHLWNNLKPTLKVAIETYLAALKGMQPAQPSGSERGEV